MSSRQLRKLRQQQELVDRAEEDEAASDEDEPVKPKGRANAFAGFALLNQADGGSDAADENEEEDEPQASVAVEKTQGTGTPSSKPKKKKKKKAKKGRAGTAAGADGADAGELDDVDKALAELSMSSKGGRGDAPKPPAEYAEDLANLLKINFSHLKVMNEMRAVFGRGTIEAARTEDAPPAAPQGRPPQGEQEVDLETFLRAPPVPSAHRPVSDVIARRNPFGQWKDTWPQAPAGGLVMKALPSDAEDLVEADGAFEEFAYAHEPNYVAMEQAFHLFIQTHDSQGMIHFLRAHPYHVATLVQVSNIAKHQDRNLALAADLCERALYTFGRVTLSTFRKKLEEGRARLSFLRPENRQFWLAAYHYVKSLMPKGTYRTALEWTKLLLSLNPADNYSVVVWAHALAIRAHEAEWFLALCGSDLFDPKWGNPLHPYVRQTAVLAKLQLGRTDEARTALAEGIAALPWLYGALFSALNLDTPKAIWGVRPRDDGEELYTKLYLSTAKDLWNNTQAMALLKETGGLVPKADVSSLAPPRPVTVDVARFVYLDGTPELLALVPQEFLQAKPNFDFDPLPPPRERNRFSNPTQQLQWAAAGDAGAMAAFGVGSPPADGRREGEAADEAAAADAEREGFLQRVLNSLWTRAAADVPDGAGEPGPEDHDGTTDSEDEPWPGHEDHR